MRKGIPILVILILSLLILIPTNFLRRDLSSEIPSQDLRVLSKLLSPLMQEQGGYEILQNLADQYQNPSLLILAGIAYGERGHRERALSALEKAEKLLPADPLPSLLYQLYTSSKPPDSETSSLIEQEVKARLQGWFRDKPIARLYRLRGRLEEASNIEKEITYYNRAILWRISALIVFWLFAFVGGTILLIRYLIIRPRKAPLPSDLLPLSWGWALAFIFLFILTSSAISSIPLLLISLPIESTSLWRNLLPLFFLSGELIGAGLVFYLVLRHFSKAGISLGDFVSRSEGWSSLAWGIGGWLTAFPIVLIAFIISYLLNAEAIRSQQDVSILFLSSSPWGKFAIALLALLIAPPVEEFLFRGLLYSSLRREFAVSLAIPLSSFFFAAVHHDIPRLLPLMVLGCLFAFLYEERRSLLPSIVAHALWNAQTLLSLVLLFG